MSIKRWRAAAAVAVAATLLGTTAACASSAPSDGGTAAPAQERVYVELLHNDIVHFNPQIIADPIVERVGQVIYEQLVRLSSDSEVLPWLAESWEVSPDGLNITFKLREGVTWHDGEAFDADDVVYNFTEVLPLHPSVGGPFGSVLESVTATDSQTVELVLSKPFGPLFEAISMQFLLPEHIYAGTDPLTNAANQAPIGTGALKFESFTAGEELTLVKNDSYWGGEVPTDRAVYPIVVDANARALAMQDGSVDLSWGLDVAQRAQFEANAALAVLDNTNIVAQAQTLMMNTERELLSTPEVRALVYSAIDREMIVERALQGVGAAAESALPPTITWARNPEVDYRVDFPRDIDAIAAGLDEAGYPVQADGWRFTLDLRYMAPVAVLSPIAEIIKSSLADVGINVNLVAEDIPVIVEKVYTQRDYDFAIFAANVSTDPSFGITRWYTCNPDQLPHQNPTGVCDDVIDAAAQGAYFSATREERAEHFRVFEERARDLMGAAPVSFSPVFTVYNTTRWEGLGETRFLREMIDWVNLTPVN